MTTIDEKFAPAQTSNEPTGSAAYRRALSGELEPLAALREVFGNWEEAAEYAKGVNERVAALKAEISHLVALSGVNVVELNGYEIRNTAPSHYSTISLKKLEPVLKALRDEGLVSNTVLERIREIYTPVEKAGSLRIESMESIRGRYR